MLTWGRRAKVKLIVSPCTDVEQQEVVVESNSLLLIRVVVVVLELVSSTFSRLSLQ